MNSHQPATVDFGGTSLSVEAIRLDIGRLVERFRSLQDQDSRLSFSSFSQLWKQERMGILHLVGWSEEENRREYVEALFQICLDFVLDSKDSAGQVGSLFCLFVLYQTQPPNLPRHKIRLTRPTWEKLYSVHENLSNEGLIEAAVVFRRLGQADAFCMSFSVPGQPTSIPMNGADLLNIPSYQAVLDDRTRAEGRLKYSVEQSHAEMDSKAVDEYQARTADDESDIAAVLRDVDRATID